MLQRFYTVESMFIAQLATEKVGNGWGTSNYALQALYGSGTADTA